MQIKKPLSSRYGKQYLVCYSNQVPKQSSSLALRGIKGARQFVEDLTGASATWQQLAIQSSDYLSWKSSHPWSPTEDFIALLLSQGKLKAVDVTQLTLWKSTHKAQPALKDGFGNQYQFIPVAASLFNTPTNTKRFASQKDAQAFIEKLGISEEDTKTITEGLSISALGQAGPTETLSQALVNGDVILTKQEARRIPTKTEFESVPPSQAQPAGLGPGSEPSVAKAAVESKLDEEAIAEALEKAAEDGTPFCEECEKAKASQAA